VHLCCVTCENTNITWYYVIPKNCNIVVSVCCTVHVKKSQCMQQLMDNCSAHKASVGLQVQLLVLWVIENLWLTVVRKESNFVNTRSLIVFCISAEATTSSQNWLSQYKMSVLPVVCENQQLSECAGWRSASSVGVRPSGRRGFLTRNNGRQRRQEGFASNIIHHTYL